MIVEEVFQFGPGCSFKDKKKYLRQYLGSDFTKKTAMWYTAVAIGINEEGDYEPVYKDSPVPAIACASTTVNVPCAPAGYGVKFITDYNPNETVSFGTLKAHCCAPKQEQKEEKMYTATESLEADQRNYLKRRVEDVKATKKADLRKTFNMDYRDTVETLADAEEAIKRIVVKKDAFTSDGKAIFNWYSPKDYLTIEPKVKADEAGYAKAKALLEKDYVDTLDATRIKPLDAALEALKTFESKTFH